MSQGKVYLVGAGVGSVAYLADRAQHLLKSAEVVVYDALVDVELLTLVPPRCLRREVGKRGGKKSVSQSEINQLLVEYCQQGKQVVRLKSGDPFIFGRSREEAEALGKAGCDFEVVPGLSSALTAPLLAGIPLTDKVLSRAFVVLSGHQPQALNWKALAAIDTLVILMAGRTLKEILEQLQHHGRSPACPIAIIRNAGRAEQQIWIGTLADILEKTWGISLSPSVTIIGEVVLLRETFQTMSHSPSSLLPLAGKTALVTRAAEQSSPFATLLQQQGAKTIEMPALEIRPPSSWKALDRAIASLPQFHWLILTSSNGVDYFCDRLTTLGKDARTLAGLKIAVVGKKTAAALKQRHLTPDLIPPNFVADSLVDAFPEPLDDKNILFPRVETGGRDVLLRELTTRGARITEVPAYQSACPDRISPTALTALQAKTIDIITFASSKTVQNFYTLLEAALPQSSILPVLENVCLASIGPQTSATCHRCFGRVDVEAQEYTLDGLTHAIVGWVRETGIGEV